MEQTFSLADKHQNLVEYISMIQGKNSDVLLSDLSKPGYPILSIRNGGILKVRQNDPTPDFLQLHIQNAQKQPSLQFHEQFRLKHKTLNISIMILDESSNDQTAISVITDITPFLNILRYSANLAKLYQLDTEVVNNINHEVSMTKRTNEKETLSFAEKVHELIKDKIDQIVLAYGIGQENFKARDRRNIVAQLYDEGVFNMKYSVLDVAKALNVSEPTIYRYIQELKEK